MITLGSGFIHPTGVAVDAAGNVFVVDNGNNAVKEIPAGNGTVQTIATGFNGPYGIALDEKGFMYVGDASNNEVKKIPVGGGTAVVIGSGFNHPTGVAVDAAGNVYVADRANNAIKKILVSDGSTVMLSFGSGNPNGVAMDATGNVYFADTNLTYITEIPAGGGSNVQVGSGFSDPTCVATDTRGDIFIGGGGLVKEIGTGGYSISPSLPAGLNFNTNTGVISGTPTAVAAAPNYTVTATNSSGSGTAVINITVKLPAKPAISYSTPQVYIATEAITPLSPGSTGGPIPSSGAFSIRPTLPSGLSFNANTGAISGTPSGASPATDYMVTATNPVGSGTAVINITVNLPPQPAISYSTPQVYTATEAITTLSPGSTGGPLPSSGAFSISPTPPSGLSFDGNTGIISGTPASASPATNYTVTAKNAGGSGTAIINITVNPYPSPVISYSSPQVYTATEAITTLSPGSTGGPIPSSGAFSISPTPPSGLSFDGNTGIISGTPASASPATNYTVTAKNAGGSGTAIINITVNPYPSPVISYSSPQTYIQGAAITPLSPTSSGVGPGGSISKTLITSSNSIMGVTIDGFENIYVANATSNNNNSIVEIPADGTGQFTLRTAVGYLTGIAADAAGNVYFIDNLNNALKEIAAGNGPMSTISTAFSSPYGVAADQAGNVYVGDAGNNAVKKILAGTTTPVAIGSGFNDPLGVAVDGSGNVYVADYGNNAIKEIQASDGSTITLASGYGGPSGVAVDVYGNVYFADAHNTVIGVITAGAHVATSFGSGLYLPRCLAVDRKRSPYYLH